MSFETDVYHAHTAGKLDAKLVEFFLPDGKIRSNEGPMWDYKVGFCTPTAVLHEESLLLCELLHDVAALYNAFGATSSSRLRISMPIDFASLRIRTISTSSVIDI